MLLRSRLSFAKDQRTPLQFLELWTSPPCAIRLRPPRNTVTYTSAETLRVLRPHQTTGPPLVGAYRQNVKYDPVGMSRCNHLAKLFSKTVLQLASPSIR
jgi:hypothetical protein